MDDLEILTQFYLKEDSGEEISPEEQDSIKAVFRRLKGEDLTKAMEEAQLNAMHRQMKQVMSKEEFESALLEEEYSRKIGGPPLHKGIPTGHYPPGVEEAGGPDTVYRECLKKGITWEELIGYKEEYDKDIIL